MSSQGSALRLFDLIQSHRVTAVIYVAAKLGLAELLRTDRAAWRTRKGNRRG